MYVHVEHYVLSGFQLLFHLRFQGAVEAVFVDFLIFQEFTVGDALAELFGREEEIFHPVTLRPPWRTAGCTDAESQIQVLSHQIIDERAFPLPLGAEKIINDYQSHMKPTAYELVFNDDNEEILRLIRKVRDSGAKLFINSLWPELCGGHDDDRAVELHQPDESWGWILNQGAKLIQTDRPALLLEYLRKKKLHD